MPSNGKFCSRCGKRAPRPGYKSCEPCAEAFRKWEHERKLRIPAGMCSTCGKRETEAGFKQCAVCRKRQAAAMVIWRSTRLEESRAYQTAFKRRRRRMALEHYGGKCECCGEAHFEFLALDHKDGGGDAHRRSVGGGAKMVEWIIAQGYPDLFRVLCHNCNQAIGYYGACPHSLE